MVTFQNIAILGQPHCLLTLCCFSMQGLFSSTGAYQSTPHFVAQMVREKKAPAYLGWHPGVSETLKFLACSRHSRLFWFDSTNVCENRNRAINRTVQTYTYNHRFIYALKIKVP